MKLRALAVVLLGATSLGAQPNAFSAAEIDQAIVRLADDVRSDRVLDLEFCQRLLKQVEVQNGRTSSRYAQLLELTIEARIRDGERRSEQLFDMALELAELRAVTKDEQPESYARALHLLGRLEQLGGRFDHALEFYQVALDLRRTLDGSPLEIARTFESLGSVLDDLGRRAEALEMLEEALEILDAEGAGGEAARVLNTLGGTLHRLGEHEEAAAAFARAIDVGRQVFGSLHPIQARSHHNLGYVAHVLGDIERAESNLRQALEVRVQVHGEVDPVTASSQAALGELEHDRGFLHKAREHLEAAWAAQRVGLGDEHPRTVATLSRLGALLADLGLGEEALEAQLEALTVSRRVYPGGDVSTAEILLRLAAVERDRGGLAPARRYLLEAQEIYRRGTKDRHVGAARVECRLAALDEVAGDSVKAAHGFALCDALLARRDLEHPGRIDSLRGLSRTARELGTASRYLQRAEILARSLVGEIHPLRSEIQVEKAVLLARGGEVTAALAEALTASARARQWVRIGVAGLSHREADRFERLGRRPLDLVVSLARRHPEVSVGAVWGEVIAARSLVLDTQVFRARLGRECAGTARRAKLEELDRSTQRLGALWHRGSGVLPEDSRARLATSLRRRAESLERDLAADPDCPMPELQEPSLDAVRERLQQVGDAAILLATARYTDLLADSGAERDRYAAWIATPGAMPLFLDLGPAAALEESIDTWRKVMLGALEGRVDEAEVEAARDGLSALLWRPLAPHLESLTAERANDPIEPAERLLWVPDGALRGVALPALRDERGRDLLDVLPPVVRLASERDLVATVSPKAHGRGLLAVGAPLAAPMEVDTGAELVDPEAPRLPTLEGAEAEVHAIVRLWNESTTNSASVAAVLLGPTATEEAVRRHAVGAEVLHFATHVTRVEVDDLLLGSALVLTGFGSFDRSGQPGDDGYLSAAEVARLDLGATSWVVLSGCESFGALQRAFRFAGARGLVTSLWPVGDRWAMQSMRALYQSFVRHGDMPLAIRDAALEVRAESLRTSGRSLPERWAAFVAEVGDPVVNLRRTR